MLKTKNLEYKITITSRQMRVGYFIAKQRKALSLTQAELAEKLGYKPASISNIEKGLRGIILSELPEWADALSVDIQLIVKSLHGVDG